MKKMKMRSRGRKEEELLPAPKPVEMLWKPGGTYDDPFNQGSDGFFRSQTLSGLESKNKKWPAPDVTCAGEGSGGGLNEACER